MVNHPNRAKPFRVTAMPASSDNAHEIHLRITGRGVDTTFEQMDRIAKFLEHSLNAAEDYANNRLERR